MIQGRFLNARRFGLARVVSLLVAFLCATIAVVGAQTPAPPVEHAIKSGCFASGLRVGGGDPDAGAIASTSFLRITAADRSFGELLALPTAPSAQISTDGLLPAPPAAAAGSFPCSIVRYGYSGASPSIFGDACPPFIPVVEDNGPVVSLSAASRSGSDSVIRIRVDYNKMFHYGIYNIDQTISFALDGKQSITLPARGVEPVYVTANFKHLESRPHHLTYWVTGMRNLEQGIVCI